ATAPPPLRRIGRPVDADHAFPALQQGLEHALAERLLSMNDDAHGVIPPREMDDTTWSAHLVTADFHCPLCGHLNADHRRWVFSARRRNPGSLHHRASHQRPPRRSEFPRDVVLATLHVASLVRRRPTALASFAPLATV